MTIQTTLSIPNSRVQEFFSKPHNTGLRLGQAFHSFMKLDKCIADQQFCDKLYNEPDDAKAREIINSITDYQN